MAVMRRGGAIAGCHGLRGYDKDVKWFMGLSGVFGSVREWQRQGWQRVYSGQQGFIGVLRM
jgi:hypothetical protein